MEEQAELIETRVKIMAALLVVFFLLLLGRTGYLQVMEGERLETYAQEQRLRLVTIPAARGSILDRNETPLAATRPAFVVNLLPTRTGYSAESIDLLGDILNVEPSAIHDAIRRQALPYAPVVVKADISPEEYTLIAENQDRLPGVMVDAWPLRHYPLGRTGSHVLGYVSRGQDVDGKAGVEGEFDAYLAGEPGTRQVEVDHRARFVSAGGQIDPVPGLDVRLTIDLELQEAAEKALATVLERLQVGVDPLPRDPATGTPLELHADGRWQELEQSYNARAGSVVVMDVRTGEILAMASHPDYDPNRFSLATHYLPRTDQWREWQEEWARLLNEYPHRLLNRAVQATYSPGSVFKIVTGLAALDMNLVDERYAVTCRGAAEIFGQSMRCWSVHGTVSFRDAIAKSCNIYFYNLSRRLGIDNLAEFSYQVGMGDRTGLLGLMESEARSVVPSREWKMTHRSEQWYPLETLHAGIGQGFHAYTPVRTATLVSAIANGGTILRPYLVQSVVGPDGTVESFEPEEVGDLGVSPANLEILRRGLLQTSQPGGTAYWRFWDYPKTRENQPEAEAVRVAGKTGTVEVQGHQPHGHFVAFAPYAQPEIAVVVLVEHGGSGYLAGAPVAREVIETYFGFRDPPEGEDAGEPGSFDIAPR